MADYYFTVNGVRICDSTRTDLSGTDDVMPTGQQPENSYIACTSLWGVNNKDPLSKEIRLEWKLSTSGTYNALSGSGDINWTADTSLVNGTGVTSGNSRCTQQSGTTYEATGLEREGANNQTVDIGNDGSSEAQWAFYVAAAGTYDFRVYDVSLGASMKEWQVTFSYPSAYTPQIMTMIIWE